MNNVIMVKKNKELKRQNMDILKHANWLRGFLDSMSNSDSISKKQIEVLNNRISELIDSIEENYYEIPEIADIKSEIKVHRKTEVNALDFSQPEEDDLPF